MGPYNDALPLDSIAHFIDGLFTVPRHRVSPTRNVNALLWVATTLGTIHYHSWMGPICLLDRHRMHAVLSISRTKTWGLRFCSYSLCQLSLRHSSYYLLQYVNPPKTWVMWVVKVVGRDSNCGQSGEINLKLSQSIASLSSRFSQSFLNHVCIMEEKGCISPAVSCEYASLSLRQPLTKSLRLHSGEMRCEAKSGQKSLKYGISSSAFLLLHALWCSLGQWDSPRIQAQLLCFKLPWVVNTWDLSTHP